ncbi:MAG: rRNA methyltransferase [Deltaproteobacteria bacterium]|nr:rRNA methyltransferase [Deltaproteobacteria bacterium]
MEQSQDSLLEEVEVVLLRPQWARNLGSVARAMKNFGLQKLTLVDSRIGSWNDAYQMAVQASDILDGAEVKTLEAALAPSRWVVGTSNHPSPGTRSISPREVAEESILRGAPTLLFGGEISGLDPAEMLRCHAVSTVPTSGSQSSLNLAQAVCVYGHELFSAIDLRTRSVEKGVQRSGVEDAYATREMLQRLEDVLLDLLTDTDWIKATRNKNAIAELIQPFYRAGLTDKEVRAWLVAFGKVRKTLNRST